MRRAIGAVFFVLAAFIGGASPVLAGDYYRFSDDRLAEFQQAGYPILVEIDASWCPVCARQRPIIEKYRKTAEFQDMRILVVDFDTQKKYVRALGAEIQSTLIAFHGATETGRLVGETDENVIHDLLNKTKG